MSIQDLPSLEEVEALKRFWQKNMDNPKLDKDMVIVCISVCDDAIKKIKAASQPDINTLSQMG
jgi:hypothetical protein